jgi:hypothetical protein
MAGMSPAVLLALALAVAVVVGVVIVLVMCSSSFRRLRERRRLKRHSLSRRCGTGRPDVLRSSGAKVSRARRSSSSKGGATASYTVLDRPGAEQAAAILHDMTLMVDTVVDHMLGVADGTRASKHPMDDETRRATHRLARNWRACNAGGTACLREIATTGDALAWLLGKSEEIGICLRDPERPDRFDASGEKINLCKYTLLHECAHAASQSCSHCDEFQRNFKHIVDYAVEAGVYEYRDYEKNPALYCGGIIGLMPGNTEECEGAGFDECYEFFTD